MTETGGSPANVGHSPRFSVVLCVGDAEPSLPALTASIDALHLDSGALEVIAVHLGSTDSSLAILRRWSDHSPWDVRLLDCPEPGDRSARSLALGAAAGTWVLFLDEDDLLTAGSLAAADRLLTSQPDVGVVALRQESAGSRPRHDVNRPATHAGAAGRIIDLREEPHALALPAVLLFRRAVLPEAGLGLDPRVGDEFGARALAAHLEMGLPAPLLGVVGDAGYRRRERRGDAAVIARRDRPRRYLDVLRHGHLELLQLARRTYGQVPAWIQHLLIDELTTWVRDGGPPGSPTRIEPGDLPAVRSLLGEVASHLDGDVIREHPYSKVEPAWLDALAHGCGDERWHAPTALLTKTDRGSGLSRLNYRFVGEPPTEMVSVAGELVGPTHAKTMAHRYLGMLLVQERILWVRLSASFELRLDGRSTPVVPAALMSAPGLGKRDVLSLARRLLRRARREGTRLEGWVVRLLARSWPFSSRFRDAWVLMDRINDADDNGQRLFEYLREDRPDINAWFVVRGGSDAWRRMRAAGFRNLVAHGSFRWKLLMEDAAWLVSSHAKKSIVDPRALRGIVDHWRWRYAFLQHGVIQSDISRWLNKLDIDLFVTSTPAELHSIAADGTTYQYSTREMRLTGLPRFDRLLAKHQASRNADRNLVLVAPTWRKWLTLPLDPRSWRRPVAAAFWDSGYLRQWTALLASDEIAAAVARRGWRLGFMPHPNMQLVLPQLELPPHVEPISFAGTDVQGIYAQCSLLVTDYSSVAFDLAYIDRPVVYFQFDAEQLLGGSHVGRAGYFDYRRDGFGPVATSAAEAVAAIVEAIERGPTPAPTYRERIDRTFGPRDGGASARVVAAIEGYDDPTRSMPPP